MLKYLVRSLTLAIEQELTIGTMITKGLVVMLKYLVKN
jgi:hypothetical protein